MNVVNYPLMGFKEFGAYQPHHFEPFVPTFDPEGSRRANGMFETSRVVNPLPRNLRDSLPFESMIPGAGARYENSRAVPGHPFPDMHRRHHARALGYGDQGWGEQNMRLDSKSLQKQFQSTELTIQTKDGDIVTIRIQEQSVQKERSQVTISKTDPSASSKMSGVQQVSSSSSEEAFDLSAILNGDEVSDVNLEKNWVKRSSDSIQVSQTSDGISTDASYRSQSYSVGSLRFEVDGSLDQDELQAIHELVQGVGELSETFFDGDMTQAFEKAMQLGYDNTEIAGFSLELRDRELNVAEQKYRAASELSQPAHPKGMFRPVGDYAYQLMALEALDQERFGGKLLNQLMAQVDANRERFEKDAEETSEYSRQTSRFSSFNRQLLNEIQTYSLVTSA